MNQTQSSTVSRSKTYEITITALMTAVTCILAPMSIPIGPVPISFTNLAIYLSLYLLGWKKGTISYLIYLLIGLVGLPVFSGFTGGPAKLAGPTGGYIIGFIVMAVIAGLVIDNCRKPWIQLIGMIVGTIVCYLFGTIWFCIVAVMHIDQEACYKFLNRQKPPTKLLFVICRGFSFALSV